MEQEHVVLHRSTYDEFNTTINKSKQDNLIEVHRVLDAAMNALYRAQPYVDQALGHLGKSAEPKTMLIEFAEGLLIIGYKVKWEELPREGRIKVTNLEPSPTTKRPT